MRTMAEPTAPLPPVTKATFPLSIDHLLLLRASLRWMR